MKTKGTQIIFSLFIILSFSGFAQWTQIGYMITGTDTASSVNAFEGFGMNLYSATNRGIFKSTDNGNSWTNISWTVPVTQTVNMLSVFEESGTTIYAGGDRRLYKSTNSGASWTWLPLPKDTMNINDIKRSGSNIVVAASRSSTIGAVYYSSNNGVTWSTATGIPSANNMNDLHVEGDTVYVAGKGGIYRSSDNGATFSFLANGINIGLRQIDRHKGSLVAGDVGGSGFYISTNNGASFNQANTTVFAGFCQVFSITESSSMILAAVSGGTACSGPGGNASIKMSVDGGNNWSPFMTGLAPGFHPEVGTNSAKTSFFTQEGKKTFRTNAVAGIKEYKPSDNIIAFFDQEEVLNIFVPNTTNIIVNVHSVEGRLLFHGEASESEIKIRELQNAAAGIYVITMTDGHKSISKKVIRQE